MFKKTDPPVPQCLLKLGKGIDFKFNPNEASFLLSPFPSVDISLNSSGSKYSSALFESCDRITAHAGMASNNVKCSFRRIMLFFLIHGFSLQYSKYSLPVFSVVSKLLPPVLSVLCRNGLLLYYFFCYRKYLLRMLLSDSVCKIALAFHLGSRSSMFSFLLVQQVRQYPADTHLATASAGSGLAQRGAFTGLVGSCCRRRLKCFYENIGNDI